MGGPWKKGQSGNPAGAAARPREFTAALRVMLKEEDPIRRKRKLRCMAEKAYEMAMEGEQWAFQEIVNRLEGKPATETTVNIAQKPMDEMTDHELTALIVTLTSDQEDGGDGDEDETAPPIDPQQLN